MRLLSGGIDVFYIDESHDQDHYVVSAIAVPMLRMIDGTWHIVWPDHFDATKAWRMEIAKAWKIPRSKELHSGKLLSGRGNYLYGKFKMPPATGAGAYRDILSKISFIPNESIFSVAVKRGASLYGKTRLEAAMYALFQRMRNQCAARQTNAMVFFDEGHPEYRELYRRAQINLPTGSGLGGWDGGQSSKSLPLDMFFKDGNEKQSKHCLFTQIADLVAFSAFLKIKGETQTLTDWQVQLKASNIHDSIPKSVLNLKVQGRGMKDGIVRIGI